jgi:YspA, cpYpsA-related SLOG family
MKVIIAGSRALNNPKNVDVAVGSAYNKWMQEDEERWQEYMLPEIVSGGAQGVDFLAELYAKKKSLKFTEFKADWDQLGKRAGFVRNNTMALYADRLIAIWDGKSKGTFHMISEMVKLNKPVFVYCP